MVRSKSKKRCPGMELHFSLLQSHSRSRHSRIQTRREDRDQGEPEQYHRSWYDPDQKNDAQAWSSIFHYYNRTHGRGTVGYRPGEKIAIKANLNNTTDHGTIQIKKTMPRHGAPFFTITIALTVAAQSDTDPARRSRSRRT